MTTLSVSLVTALVGAVLASIGTYLAARRDLQLKFDDSLRDLRITRYEELWKALRPLAKYGRPTALSHKQTSDLIAALSTWYFDTGGLVLSGVLTLLLLPIAARAVLGRTPEGKPTCVSA